MKLERLKQLLFSNTSIRQTVVKNTFWLTIGTVASRLIRAVVIIYAARILGTEGYGVFSYAVSFSAFFVTFSDMGLGGLLTRDAVRKREELPTYISTTFGIKLALLGATVIVLLAFTPALVRIPAAQPLIPFMAFLLIFDSLRTYGFSITRAENKMELEAGLTIGAEIFITGFSLAVLFLKPSTNWLSLAYAAGSGCGLLLTFIVLRKDFGVLLSKFDRTLVKPLLAAAWPLAIIGFLGAFFINIDNVILGIYRSASELGLYAAAQRPIQLAYLIPSLLAASIFTVTNHLIHEGNHERVRGLLERSLAGILTIGFPLMVGGIVLGRPLIGLVFGAEYLGAALTFQILLLTVPLVFTGTIIGNTIFAYDRQRIFILSTGIGAATNIIFDLLLIPAYGIAGSAVATVIAQILINVINWREMKKLIPFSLLPHLKTAILATVLAGALAWGLQALGVHVILNVMVCVALYALILIARRDPLLATVRFWK